VYRIAQLLIRFRACLRAPACLVAGIALASLAPAAARAQDCPTAQMGKTGFVVERTERQKTEIFHADGDIVRTIMRYDGKTLLETTQFQGLFHLDRLDRGRRIKFEPRTDLKALFPLKSGRTASAKFISEDSGRYGRLYVEIAVKSMEDLFIGACKYQVLKLERSESRSAEPPRYRYTDYYSPELKLILAKEYRERDGRTTLIKFDRIYPVKN
jgi:hypothetical protein